MSNKDFKNSSNSKPEQLEDKDLDQVNGGYLKYELKNLKSTAESKTGKLDLDTKYNKERIVAQSGSGEI